MYFSVLLQLDHLTPLTFELAPIQTSLTLDHFTLSPSHPVHSTTTTIPTRTIGDHRSDEDPVMGTFDLNNLTLRPQKLQNSTRACTTASRPAPLH